MLSRIVQMIAFVLDHWDTYCEWCASNGYLKPLPEEYVAADRADVIEEINKELDHEDHGTTAYIHG